MRSGVRCRNTSPARGSRPRNQAKPSSRSGSASCASRTSRFEASRRSRSSTAASGRQALPRRRGLRPQGQRSRIGLRYRYIKTVSLPRGKTQMMLTQRLESTGAKPIDTQMYNHNFFVLDGQPSGPDIRGAGPVQVEPFNVRGDASCSARIGSTTSHRHGQPDADQRFRRLGEGLRHPRRKPQDRRRRAHDRRSAVVRHGVLDVARERPVPKPTSTSTPHPAGRWTGRSLTTSTRCRALASKAQSCRAGLTVDEAADTQNGGFGAGFVLLLLNTGYISAFATPTIFYMANVLPTSCWGWRSRWFAGCSSESRTSAVTDRADVTLRGRVRLWAVSRHRRQPARASVGAQRAHLSSALGVLALLPFLSGSADAGPAHEA